MVNYSCNSQVDSHLVVVLLFLVLDLYTSPSLCLISLREVFVIRDFSIF